MLIIQTWKGEWVVIESLNDDSEKTWFTSKKSAMEYVERKKKEEVKR